MDKKASRLRRIKRTRHHIRAIGRTRLCVHRTPRHIYAQIVSPDGSRVLACASTLESALREQVGFGGNVAAAEVVGRVIAERARAIGVESVAFDRGGFRYHGRVQALANKAREHGLAF